MLQSDYIISNQWDDWLAWEVSLLSCTFFLYILPSYKLYDSISAGHKSNYRVISVTLSGLRCCMSFAPVPFFHLLGQTDATCCHGRCQHMNRGWCSRESGRNIIVWLINCSGSWKVYNDLGFWTHLWHIILLEAGIRRWGLCGHNGMDLVSNSTQAGCGVEPYSVGTKGPEVCQKISPTALTWPPPAWTTRQGRILSCCLHRILPRPSEWNLKSRLIRPGNIFSNFL